jgi:hypothetical protein
MRDNFGTEWRNDWQAFAELLEAKILNRESEDELAAFFGGVEVCWTGTVDRIDFESSVSVVTVTLPTQCLKDGNGTEALLDGLVLAVDAENESKWDHVKVGDNISFVATFDDKSAIFPPIEVKTLSTGKSTVSIRVRNSIPASFGTKRTE